MSIKCSASVDIVSPCLDVQMKLQTCNDEAHYTAFSFMPTSPVMQIHVTASEILWKINISVCISSVLYSIAGISSYNYGVLYICSKFV
jgi:hypothetical protein